MRLSLKKLGGRIFDQANPFDNGRTFKQRTPTNNRSVIGQATHNGITNTIGNFAVKPVQRTIAATTVEPARLGAAIFTHNRPAIGAAQSREWQNIQESIPGAIAGNVIHGGQAGYNLAFKAPALELLNKPNAANRARVAGLKEFNSTVVGQAVSPLEYGIANLAHASAAKQAGVGLDPNATGAQKFVGTPVVGTLGTYGLAKGAGNLMDKRIKMPVDIKKTTEIPVQVKPGPRTSKVDVKVTKKIPVRNIPSQQELVDRYNAHMANLSAKYGRSQVPITTAGKPGKQAILSERAIYNDVGYQAEKQKIQQAYQDGTLGKPIAVKNGPAKPTVTAKQKAKVELVKQEMQGVTRSPTDVLPSETTALAKLQGKKTLTKQEQIQEALLREKAGLPPFDAAAKPAATAKVAQPDLTGLEPLSPYSVVPKAPGAFDRAWMSVRGAISRHGTGGAEVARRLGEKRNASELGQEDFIKQIPTVQSLNKGEFRQFTETLDRLSSGERNIEAPSQKIIQAVDEWKQAIPTVRDRAVKAGLDVGDLGEYYFPRQYKNLFKGGNAMREYAQQLVDNGTAKNIGDAMDKLRYMRQEYTRPFGNLEKTRDINLPGYERTHEALANYVSRSFERIAHAEQFGAKNEILNQLKTRMSQEGYDVSPGGIIDRNLRIAFNDVDKQTTLHRVSGGIRTVNAFRSLGGAGISNATQLPVNTSTIAGIGRTAKGIVKLAASPKARAEARETGVLLDHSISNLAKQQLGTKGTVATNIASPLFRTIERFNRQATAIVGKDFGNSLVKKVYNRGDQRALEMLNKLGVKGEIGAKLTRDQEIQASRGLVEAAQFKVDPMDLPGWTDSAAGKLVAQFRTFQYKQTDFMYNHVLKEAMRGNLLPLTRFVATGVPFGTAALVARGVLKGNPQVSPQDNKLGIAGKALAQVGGPGLLGSEALNLKESVKYDNLTGGVAGTVGGPTASGVVETLQNIDKGIGKHNWKPLAKEGIRQLPTAGPFISQKVFPKKEQPGPIQAGKSATLEQMNSQADKERADLDKKMKPNDYGLTQLANGKYWYQVGNDSHVTDNLKEAQEAVAVGQLKHSKKDMQIVGDKVYYKDSQGDIHTQDKALYDWNQNDSKNKLELDRAYAGGDINKWMDLAQKEWDALENKKKFYNPKTEQDKIDDIILLQENLMQKAEKYQQDLADGKGFGDNKTGKVVKARKGGGGSGGGGGGSGSVGSAYKYAISLNAGGSVAKPRVTAHAPALARGRVSGGAKPKVSLRKSKV